MKLYDYGTSPETILRFPGSVLEFFASALCALAFLLAEQFRVETRITKRILGGYVRKLMLTRGFQNIARGHHSMDDERLFRSDGRVLHYKWTSIVLDHLAERIATRERTGDKWTQESQRFLAYWQRNGRIIFADCE